MNEFENQLAKQPLKCVPPNWRAQILTEARTQATRDLPAPRFEPLSWLRELLWPCPQAWGALAAVWIVIAAVQLTTPGAARLQGGEVAKSHGLSISEQQRELARLLDANSEKKDPPSADRPRGARPVDYTFV